jgi:hypothetical protein
MHGRNRGPFPHMRPFYLLRTGERVEVEVVAYEPAMHKAITDAISEFDELGILIDREGLGSVLVPWTSVSTVTKLTA